MDKAVIDLGKSEATSGLIFVCLSRAKRLGDLLIEPMPFERFSRVKSISYNKGYERKCALRL